MNLARRSAPRSSDISQSATNRPRPSWRTDDGLLSTELAILMPVLVVFAFVGIFAAQVQRHGGRTQSAADSAARTAAYFPAQPSQAETAARTAAERICQGTVSDLSLDWAPGSATAMRPGSVVVELTCTEDFGSMGGLLRDPNRSARARAVATIEFWQES